MSESFKSVLQSHFKDTIYYEMRVGKCIFVLRKAKLICNLASKHECIRQNEYLWMLLESNFESRVTLGLTFLLDDDDRFWRRAK